MWMRTLRPGPPRWWPLLGAVLSMALALAGGLWRAQGHAIPAAPNPAAPMAVAQESDRLPVLGTLPDFELIDRSERRITREFLRSHVWVATFFFSRCRDSCTLQNTRLAQIQGEFAAAPDVRLVSISVDPDHDTPVVLRQYADGFGADPERWLFLTGDLPTIVRLTQEFFRLSLTTAPRGEAVGPAPVLGHSPGLVLVDREGRIRGYYDSADPADAGRLRRDVARVREGLAG